MNDELERLIRMEAKQDARDEFEKAEHAHLRAEIGEIKSDVKKLNEFKIKIKTETALRASMIAAGISLIGLIGSLGLQIWKVMHT